MEEEVIVPAGVCVAFEGRRVSWRAAGGWCFGGQARFSAALPVQVRCVLAEDDIEHPVLLVLDAPVSRDATAGGRWRHNR